ncbi:MAG: hypothetical protein AB7I25_07435 [Vicinamibacterales bacterium]
MSSARSPDLRLLFATSFSAACVQAGRAVARLAEACHVELTLVHVVPPGGRNIRVHQRLEQFLHEHEVGRRCRRVLVESPDPAAAVAELCEHERFDAVVAPGSSRWGVSLSPAASFRGQLLRRSRVPVWTAGRALSAAAFHGRIATVACVLDLTSGDDAWWTAAEAFADRVGARLQLLALVPPVDEGLLTYALDARAPLTVARAVERLRALSAGCAAGIDVQVGEGVSALNAQIARCGADLLFVSRRWSLRGLDRLRCPVVSVDTASIGPVPWSFQDAVVRRIPVLTLDRDAVASA